VPLQSRPPIRSLRDKLIFKKTWLEIRQRPSWPARPLPDPDAVVRRVERPGAAFYRSLYLAVGSNWLWDERLAMPEETLEALLCDPDVHLYVLEVQGTAAGFAELNAARLDPVDLAYFGLAPGFFGRKLGPALLDFAIREAFDLGARRLRVNTCTLDHSSALETYIRAGFEPYKQTLAVEDDPRLLGLLPEDVAPHVSVPRPLDTASSAPTAHDTPPAERPTSLAPRD